MSLTSQCIVLPASSLSVPTHCFISLYPLTCRHCFVPHLSAHYYIPWPVGIASSLTSAHCFVSFTVHCFTWRSSQCPSLALSLSSQRVASPALALNSLFHLLTHCFSASAQLIASSLRPVRALPHSQRGALSLSEHCFLCVASQRITSLLAS